MLKTNYNPDILTCLANLSNDEVFTPPKLVNDILDILPQKLFTNKNTTFLDPVSKSGVFLREIAKRLMEGLESEIPDKQERVNHIFKNQIFGIAITELTSLLSRRSVYCSKTANGKYSVCETFDNKQGNIIFNRTKHTWKNNKCTYCSASKEVYNRDKKLETYAYQFIHTDKPKNIFNMKFDVIIGNPPYQLSTGGSGRQAKPIYQKFIKQAQKLNPRYLTMIIPARWYSGGFGLNTFRYEMLNDKRIKYLVDFDNASAVFPGVDIAGGVCYFLWDKNYNGDCIVNNIDEGDIKSSKRPLNEFSVFIRRSESISILRKIFKKHKASDGFLYNRVNSIGSFGLPTNYKPTNKGVPCQFIQRIGLKYAKPADVLDKNSIIKKWKLLIPKAPIAGQTDFSKPITIYHANNTIIIKPGVACTDSWITAGSFDTEDEVVSYRTYFFTKIIRFLILQTVISQDINKRNFLFVPDIGLYKGIFTDEILRKKWNITEEEWKFIDSKIK